RRQPLAGLLGLAGGRRWAARPARSLEPPHRRRARRDFRRTRPLSLRRTAALAVPAVGAARRAAASLAARAADPSALWPVAQLPRGPGLRAPAARLAGPAAGA